MNTIDARIRMIPSTECGFYTARRLPRKWLPKSAQKSFCSFIAAPMSPLTFSFPVM